MPVFNPIPRSNLMPPGTVVIFGDSITGQNTTNASEQAAGAYGYGAKGYFSWGNVLLGHRLKLLNNAGVSGNTTTQMLARIQQDVIAYSPGWCIVQGGGNDLASDNNAAIQANLQAIYEALVRAGIRPIASTIFPTTSANTAAIKRSLYRTNAWIRDYARTNGLPLADFNAAMADPATGDPRTGYTTDGIHPTIEGAARAGEALYNTLVSRVTAANLLISTNADADNLLANGLMTGDTAGVATSWGVNNQGSGATFSASKVARTSGPGDWQQLSVTAATTSQVAVIAQTNSSVGTSFNVGDTVYAQCAFETDAAGWSANQLNLTLSVGGTAVITSDLRRTGADAFGSYRPASGVLRTPPVTVPSGATNLAFAVNLRGARAS